MIATLKDFGFMYCKDCKKCVTLPHVVNKKGHGHSIYAYGQGSYWGVITI